MLFEGNVHNFGVNNSVSDHNKELELFNTFAAKRDCSRIYRSLPNATTVEIERHS